MGFVRLILESHDVKGQLGLNPNGNATRLTCDTSDAPVGPPSCCLYFYLATFSAREFILKKSPIIIHSASSSPVAVSCACPVLDTAAHSPHYCRAPHPPPLVHAPSGVLPATSRRAHYPPSRSKPGAGSADSGDARVQRWCWMPVVLVRYHSPQAPTLTTGIDRHRRSPSLMLQIYILNISDVLKVCCSYFIRMLQK
jgi:hypothetical protein